MPNDFLPDSDTALLQWLTTFLAVANTNLTQLGISSSDLTFLTADDANLTTQLTTVDTAKKALKSAVATKNTTHKRIATNARALVRRIQGNSAVPVPLKDALGINPRNNKPSPLTPTVPTNLTATGTRTTATTSCNGAATETIPPPSSSSKRRPEPGRSCR